MKRLTCAVGASVLLALGVAGPAAAQQSCGDGPYQTPCTTTTRPTTTTTRPTTTTTPGQTTTTLESQRPTTTLPPTTTTDAPPPASQSGRTTNPTPNPGEAVPIAAPASSGQPTIDATKPAAAVMLPASGAADIPMPTPAVTQNADGSLSISVTVPPSTPPGVYLIAVVGVDASGRSRAIIVPVVVRRVRAAAVASAAPDEQVIAASATSKPVTLPPGVREVAASIDAVGASEAVEDAVVNEGAELVIEDGLLVLHRPGAETSDGSRPLVAAFAVALGGAGLVLLRRRTPAISKRSR